MKSNHLKCIYAHEWNSVTLSDNSERKYVHLSNDLMQSFETRYIFRVWIHPGRCGLFLMSYLSIVWWWFAIIFVVSYNQNLDPQCRAAWQKIQGLQGYCLTYTFTGVHEIYHPWWWPSPEDLLAVKGEALYRGIVNCLSITGAAGLLDQVYNSLK